MLPGCGADPASSSSPGAVVPPARVSPAARIPPRFYWGVGIENTWMAQADPAHDGSRRVLDEFLLTQHYDRWKADLTLARDLGVGSIRYGMPWYRAEPAPGEYDFSWLDAPVRFLVDELGIVPILDLVHYGTPTWMAEGIGDARFPEALARYATAIAEHFRGRVTHYTPFNEPQVSVGLSGAFGSWPPYQASASSTATLGVRIARAMVLATRSLRSALADVTIVSADPMNWTLADAVFDVAGLDAATLEDLRSASGSFPACLAYGKVGPGHRFADYLVAQGVPPGDLEWLAASTEPPDIVGYNHYPDIADFPGSADFTQGGSVPLDRAAFEATQKVEAALHRAQAYFGLPIYLTETSAGLTGAARAAYATALYDMVERLRASAVPLVGLNWWPLFEAAQWIYREQPDRALGEFLVPGGWNNGLYDLVDDGSGGLTRVATPAVAAFRAVIARDRAG